MNSFFNKTGYALIMAVFPSGGTAYTYACHRGLEPHVGDVFLVPVGDEAEFYPIGNFFEDIKLVKVTAVTLDKTTLPPDDSTIKVRHVIQKVDPRLFNSVFNAKQRFAEASTTTPAPTTTPL